MGSCTGKRNSKELVAPAGSRLDTDSSQGTERRGSLVQVFRQDPQRIHPSLRKCYEDALAGRSDAVDLNFKFVYLGGENAAHLGTVLPYFQRLERLRLWKAKIGAEGCVHLNSALLRLPHLKLLALEDNDIRYNGLENLAQGLKSLQELEELYLHANHLGPEGGLVLSEILVCLQNLRSVTVDENKIEDQAGQEVLSSLHSSCSTLRLLGLSYNYLTDTTAAALLLAVPSFPRLQKLSFGGNLLEKATKEALKVAAPQVSFEF